MNRMRLLLAIPQIVVNHNLTEFFAIFHVLNSFFLILQLDEFLKKMRYSS